MEAIDNDSDILNQMDSGHNFFTFIKQPTVVEDTQNKKNMVNLGNNDEKQMALFSSIYVYGVIDNLKIYSLDLNDPTQTVAINDNTFKILSIKEDNYKMANLNFGLEGYEPIQVSCNKFSMACVLKQSPKGENDIKKIREEFEKLKIVSEIKSSLKSRNLTFQSYFLEDIVNEHLFGFSSENSNKKNESNFYISENDLKEKIRNLISNSDKHQEEN